MKTLIIGSGGQLGKALSSILENSIPLSHDIIDLRNVNNIENILDKYSFDTIINCAAMTSVDKCESDILFSKMDDNAFPQCFFLYPV